MDKFECIYLKENFFINNNFVEMLDSNDVNKRTRRNYIYLKFDYENNKLLIPLRSEVTNLNKLGNVSYQLPTRDKPNAGLDFRKILIVSNNKYNDNTYIEKHGHCKIPKAQRNLINSEYDKIKKQVIKYINDYIKSAKKNRHIIDKKFKFSTLHNFHKELNI